MVARAVSFVVCSGADFSLTLQCPPLSDVCSNTGNWAYVQFRLTSAYREQHDLISLALVRSYGAGVGTDPRNRTFNILKQALDYDSHGDYVKFWVPELRDVPAQFVQHPWTMTAEERKHCGSQFKDYPQEPIIMRGEWKKHMKRAPGEGSKQGKANPGETSSGFRG